MVNRAPNHYPTRPRPRTAHPRPTVRQRTRFSPLTCTPPEGPWGGSSPTPLRITPTHLQTHPRQIRGLAGAREAPLMALPTSHRSSAAVSDGKAKRYVLGVPKRHRRSERPPLPTLWTCAQPDTTRSLRPAGVRTPHAGRGETLYSHHMQGVLFGLLLHPRCFCAGTLSPRRAPLPCTQHGQGRGRRHARPPYRAEVLTLDPLTRREALARS